jgi:hypothetical protein
MSALLCGYHTLSEQKARVTDYVLQEHQKIDEPFLANWQRVMQILNFKKVILGRLPYFELQYRMR